MNDVTSLEAAQPPVAQADPAEQKNAPAGDGGYYVILEFGDDDRWLLVAKDIAARSAEHAVRQRAEKTGRQGVLVAIPARSWKPVTVAVKTTTTLVLEDVPS